MGINPTAFPYSTLPLIGVGEGMLPVGDTSKTKKGGERKIQVGVPPPNNVYSLASVKVSRLSGRSRALHKNYKQPQDVAVCSELHYRL
jgi:hypothetical protein